MKVTERLASLFIEESLRDRSALAEGTNQFLEPQLQEARNRLIDQEQRLEAYPRAAFRRAAIRTEQQHAGDSKHPDAIQTLTQSLTQDKDRRQTVDRLLAEAEAFAPVPLSAAAISWAAGGR